MKAVALILALAVITGCNAHVVHQADAATIKWEETVDRFWQYVADLNTKADGAVQDFKASQLTRELDTVATYLGDLQSRTSQNFDTMKENVEPFVQQASDTTTKKLSDISTILKTQAEGLGQQLESQTEAIKTQLEATVQKVLTCLQGKLNALTKMISPYAAHVIAHVDNIREKVKETTTA